MAKNRISSCNFKNGCERSADFLLLLLEEMLVLLRACTMRMNRVVLTNYTTSCRVDCAHIEDDNDDDDNDDDG